MIRKVWVNGFTDENGSFIDSHWETISGSEAEVNAIYSGSRYQGMKVHKKNEPGIFGGMYENREFSVWSGTDLQTRTNKGDDSKMNQEDND